MKKRQVPPGKKSEQKALFKRAWVTVLPYLAHNYAAFTQQHFKKQGKEQDMTHIYSVKKNGYEDWDILEYWVNEFVPQDIEVEGFVIEDEFVGAA